MEKILISQVPLGVHLFNENKLDEMAMILEDLHERYVPTKPFQEMVTLQDGTQ